MRTQTFLILTQRHSCALNGCSGDVPTDSLAFMCPHKCSGHVQYLLKGVHVHSQAFRGCSILTQRHSCALNRCSGAVQYWLKGVHAHSQAFRECSVLTQIRTFSWSHHVESCSIMTQWYSCALNGCSHSLNGIHAHSMGVQGVFNTDSLAFMCTQWVFRGCSRSLNGVHTHSQVFRKCSKRVQPVHVNEGPMNMFSNLQTQRPYKLALNFHCMPFLWLRQAIRHGITLEYMIGRWSQCPPMRLATKNKKVLQKFRKWDISKESFNYAINFLYVRVSLSVFQVRLLKPISHLTPGINISDKGGLLYVKLPNVTA